MSPAVAPSKTHSPAPQEQGDVPKGVEASSAVTAWPRLLGRLEFIVGGAILLAAAGLRWRQATTAGGLWRDEATSIQVASLPTLAEVWRYLEFDSYPVLYHLVLRAWSGDFGDGDASLRVLGCLIGTGVLGAFWMGARALGVRVPLLAWALLGLNPLIVRYGDSTRAYGLGCLLAVLAAAAVWRAGQTGRVQWRRVALAALTGVVSVQCLYHNAALLLASCAGVAGAAGWRGRPKVALAVLAAGIPAALSLLPYLPTIHRTGQWSVLFRYPVTLPWLWQRVSEVTGSPRPAGSLLWTALVLGAVGLAGWRAVKNDRSPAPADRQARAQGAAAATLVLALGFYAVFLFVVSYVTEAWYYLAILSLVAVCLDGVLGQPRETAARAVRLACAAGFALWGFAPAWGALKERSTNVDFVARQLNVKARENDLVVVIQWEQAISLNRYYQGAAPLETVPPLPDHTVHRYDLVRRALQTPGALRPVFARMEAVLRGGGRVWVVGEAPVPEVGQRVAMLPPARPDAHGDWHAADHYANWYAQVGQFLVEHCTRAAPVPVRPAGEVNENESTPLTVVSGWQ